jgi:hypothetical protein
VNRRTARGNRIGLALAGAVLFVAGAYALARGLDWNSGALGRAASQLITPGMRHFVTTHAAWFWSVTAIVCAILALLALRWLLVQARTEAIGTFSLERDKRRGTTRLPADAVTDAFEDDLQASLYIQQASAVLVGSADNPHLMLIATLRTGADPTDAIERIGQALSRLRTVLEHQTLKATVRLRTTSNS